MSSLEFIILIENHCLNCALVQLKSLLTRKKEHYKQIVKRKRRGNKEVKEKDIRIGVV